MNRGVLCGASLLPSRPFLLEGWEIRAARPQTLPNQDRQFTLDHLEPGTMLGRTVECRFRQNPERFGGLKRRIERRRRMNGESINDHPNGRGVGK